MTREEAEFAQLQQVMELDLAGAKWQELETRLAALFNASFSQTIFAKAASDIFHGCDSRFLRTRATVMYLFAAANIAPWEVTQSVGSVMETVGWFGDGDWPKLKEWANDGNEKIVKQLKNTVLVAGSTWSENVICETVLSKGKNASRWTERASLVLVRTWCRVHCRIPSEVERLLEVRHLYVDDACKQILNEIRSLVFPKLGKIR